VLDDNEYSRLLKACSKSTNRYLKPLVLFAMETAMRKGELLQLRYRNINFDRRTLLIPFTKTGKPRTIPLSTKAIEILRSMPRRLDGKVFPLTVDSLRNSFKIAKQKAAIEGFRFHDIRRMSCSSLFEKGFSLPEVQMFSGHRTSSILLSTYTKLSAEKIANKLKARGH
jgi:integrase